jgi:hypothetical protein
MKNISQHAAIIAFMNNFNAVRLDNNSRSTKYTVYNIIAPNWEGNFYVGKKGALRKGKTIAESIPLSEKVRQEVIEKGKEILQKQS